MRHIFYLILLQLFLPTFIGAENIPDPVFYRNTRVEIEFRILLEDQEKIPWILLQNREGLPQKVSKEIVIGNNDILGFTTDDYTLDFDDDKGFKIHFEPDSWERIRETTSRLNGKRIALIRDGQIYWTPTMYEAITHSAVVSFGSAETSIEEFLKDFPTENIPEHLHSETLHEKFLTDWIENHPQDLGALRELVNHYLEDRNNLKCKKALTHAQRFVKARPKDSMMQIHLMQCYQLIGNYEKALATGVQAISHAPSMEKMFLHRIVGDFQYEMGNEKEALKSLRESLEIMRQSKLPKKEDMIQETVDHINFILAH